MKIKDLYEKKRAKLSELEVAAKAADDVFDDKLVDALTKEVGEIDNQITTLKNANDALLKQVEQADRDVPEEKKDKNYIPLRDQMDMFLRGVETKDGKRLENVDREGFVMAEKRAYDWNKTDATGGYLVPDEIADQVAAARAFTGGMVTPGLCRWIYTSTGRKVEIPVVNDTSTKAAVVQGSTALTSGSDVTYSTQDLDFHKITTHVATIANELVQDAAFDVVAHVLELQTERLMRGLNYYFTLGSGSSEPYGIQATSTKGVDAATVRGVTRDNIVDLIYSVNRSYRGPGAAFQMSDATVGYIRKLKESSTYNESPLWQDSMRDGEPMRLEGYPVCVNSDMDDLEAYNLSVFFGDWKRFWIAEALPMKIIRLDEYYKLSDQIGTAILGRWASNLAAISGDTPIKHIRQPST